MTYSFSIRGLSSIGVRTGVSPDVKLICDELSGSFRFGYLLVFGLDLIHSFVHIFVQVQDNSVSLQLDSVLLRVCNVPRSLFVFLLFLWFCLLLYSVTLFHGLFGRFGSSITLLIFFLCFVYMNSVNILSGFLYFWHSFIIL